jgi:hypothetical protein
VPWVPIDFHLYFGSLEKGYSNGKPNKCFYPPYWD